MAANFEQTYDHYTVFASKSKILMETLTSSLGYYAFPMYQPSLKLDDVVVTATNIIAQNNILMDTLNDMTLLAGYIVTELGLANVTLDALYSVEATVSVPDINAAPVISVVIKGIFTDIV